VVQAYILIRTESGKALHVKKELAFIPGMKQVDRVMGPFDIISLVEAENTKQIGDNILRDIQSVDGIRRTLTCPVI